ncbi:hypothetical protein HK101_004921 [Irineochytrium annulatum]|nr:hypothetical protein HK101_004921 [Irineochytrium annulatum]
MILGWLPHNERRRTLVTLIRTNRPTFGILVPRLYADCDISVSGVISRRDEPGPWKRSCGPVIRWTLGVGIADMGPPIYDGGDIKRHLRDHTGHASVMSARELVPYLRGLRTIYVDTTLRWGLRWSTTSQRRLEYGEWIKWVTGNTDILRRGEVGVRVADPGTEVFLQAASTCQREASRYVLERLLAPGTVGLTTVKPGSFFRFSASHLPQLVGLLTGMLQIGGRLNSLSLGEDFLTHRDPDGTQIMDIQPDGRALPRVVVPSLARTLGGGGRVVGGTNIELLLLCVELREAIRIADAIMHDLRRQLVALEFKHEF